MKCSQKMCFLAIFGTLCTLLSIPYGNIAAIIHSLRMIYVGIQTRLNFLKFPLFITSWSSTREKFMFHVVSDEWNFRILPQQRNIVLEKPGKEFASILDQVCDVTSPQKSSWIFVILKLCFQK